MLYKQKDTKNQKPFSLYKENAMILRVLYIRLLEPTVAIRTFQPDVPIWKHFQQLFLLRHGSF